MKPITKRTQRDYSLAFKLQRVQLVNQVEKGEITYKQAQDYYSNTRMLYCFSLAS